MRRVMNPVRVIVLLHLSACFRLVVKAADESAVPLSRNATVKNDDPTTAPEPAEPSSPSLKLMTVAPVKLKILEEEILLPSPPELVPVTGNGQVNLPAKESKSGPTVADGHVQQQQQQQQQPSPEQRQTATAAAAPPAPAAPPAQVQTSNIFTHVGDASWTLEQKISYVENAVCSSMCGKDFLVGKSIRAPSSCQQCHCDPTCLEYHTCCPDVLLEGKTKYQGLAGDCVELIPTGVNTTDLKSLNNQLNRLSSMVTNCPTLSEAGTWSKCETPDLDRLEDHLPVTDATTEVTYRNVHCAKCHNVGLDVLHTWGLEIGCGGGNADLLLQSKPSRRELYRMLTSEEEVTRTGCYLLYVPRGKMFRRECRYTQHPVIETCNETGLWTPELYDREIERACLRYTSLFLNRYKNLFCYMCNIDQGYVAGHLKTLIKDSAGAVFGRLSFSALVDFNDVDVGGGGSATALSVERECRATQFYDNFTCSCRDIRCNEGKELVTEDNTCHRFVSGRTIGYEACAKVNIRFYGGLATQDIAELQAFHKSNPLHVLFKWTSSVASWCPGDKSLVINFFILDIDLSGFESSETRDEKFQTMGVKYCQALIQNEEVPQVEHCYMDFVDACPDNTGLTSPCHSNASLSIEQVEGAKRIFYGEAEVLARSTFIAYRKTNPCAFVELPASDFEETEYMLRHIASNGTIEKSKADVITRNSSVRLCLDDYMQLTQVKTSHCMDDDGTDTSFDTWTTAGIISVVCSCISLLFLVLTFVTYLIFDKLRSGGGKNIMMLTVILFIAIALYEFTIEQFENKALCSAFGVLIHYFWLASVFSMNACTVERFYKLCFPLRSRSFFLSDKPFLMATVWTFVCPLLVVCCNAGINFAVKQDIGYGNPFLCYINEKYSRILSFVVPMCAIVVCNLLLLIFTVVKLRRHSSLTGDLKVAQTRIGLVACVRLSVVTGVTWLVSFLYEALPYPVMGYIFTALIGLQGVIFFFSIVVNRRVIDLYKALWASKMTSKGSSSDGSRGGTDSKTGLMKTEKELQESPRVTTKAKNPRLIHSTNTSVTRLGSADSGFVGGGDIDAKGENRM